MGTSTIDGVIEAVDLKRSFRGLSVFNSIRFKLDDGTSRTVLKQVARQAVADQLTPGSAGRFYLFTGLDVKGIHGVRSRDGGAVCDFPSGNEKIFLIVALVNIAWIALRISTEGDIPLLGLALLIFGTVAYVMMRRTRREAETQYAGDQGQPRVTAQPAPEPGA